MKYLISLLFAFTTFALSNAQSIFDEDIQKEISSLLGKGKHDQVKNILQEIRSKEWSKLNCEEQAITYRLFGNLHYNLYEDNLALKYYLDSSYQKVLECDLPGLENDLLNNIGAIYDYDKKHLLASKYYNKLRLNYLSEEIKPTEKSFHHLSNLAAFYEGYGDLYNTFLCAWKAKQIGESLDLNLYNVHHLLGIYFDRTKQYEEAIENYAKAIEIKSSKGEPIPTTTLFNQALAYRFKKDYDRSSEILKQLLQDPKTSDKWHYHIMNLEGMIHADQGQYKEAELKFSQIDDLKDAISGKSFHSENMADLKLKMGDHESAILIYEKLISDIDKKWDHLNYIPTSSRDLLKQTELNCLHSKALYLNSKNGKDRRQVVFENYSSVRNNVAQILKSNWESQSSNYLLDEIYPNLYYVIMSYLDEYSETKDPKFVNQAYQILSEFKNQILERDIQSRIQLKENLADTVLGQYYKLKSALNSQYADKEEQSEQSRIQLIEKFEKQQLKFDSILIDKGSLFTLKPKSLVEIQNSLSQNEAFLDLYFAEEKLIRFWITNSEVKTKSTQISTALVFDFLESVKSGRPINQASNDSIFATLFSGINLQEINSVTVHTDGLFHKIPLGALQNLTSGKYLIENIGFRYLLSTDPLYIDQYQWQGNQCLGVASDYDKNRTQQADSSAMLFGKLIGTTAELTNLFEYYKTDSLTNSRATYKNLFDQISNKNYNILQLSLHGILDDRFPALSGLIFEKAGGVDLVDLNKMTGLNINTDLTIINSCHSGDGEHITGEAISNLNTSLFISGSKANIVNLWTSSDIASSELLKDFHNELSNGATKSKALQLAKQKYLTSTSPSFRHPKYWSSLVLFGNDSPIDQNKFTGYIFFSCLIIVLLVLFLIWIFFKK